MPVERLQKIIAAAGIASRRKAEQIISGGLVSVNGQVVTELGSKADPAVDHIRVNGKLLHGPERHVYLLMNKPKGYVTTLHDPEHRPTVMDLLHGVGARVYPVGRLDYASEGLLLLTNDGEFANVLMKAASHVPKTYMVKVAGKPKDEGLSKLRSGLLIGSETGRRVKTAPARVNLIREANNPWYEITLIEGKNRQIRRMFEEIGHHVEKIKRVRYGSLELDVHPGKFRRLTPDEVDRLKSMTKPGADPARFIPIFVKPKVTYAKTSSQPAKSKLIARSPARRPPGFTKPDVASAKTGRQPAGKKFTSRGSAFPPSAPARSNRFAQAAARPFHQPTFQPRSSSQPASTPATGKASFARTTSTKRNQPKFAPPSSDARASTARPFNPRPFSQRPAGRPASPAGRRHTNRRRSPKSSS